MKLALGSHSRFLNWSSWEHHTVEVNDAKCIVWRQTRAYSWNTFPACHLLSWCMVQNDRRSVNMRMSNANYHEWTYFERGEIPLERTALTCIEYRNILLYWLFVKSVSALANLLETFCWQTDIQTDRLMGRQTQWHCFSPATIAQHSRVHLYKFYFNSCHWILPMFVAICRVCCAVTSCHALRMGVSSHKYRQFLSITHQSPPYLYWCSLLYKTVEFCTMGSHATEAPATWEPVWSNPP